MENNINIKTPSNQDEVDLRHLLDIIWSGKWVIIASTISLSIIAIFIFPKIILNYNLYGILNYYGYLLFLIIPVPVGRFTS